MVEIHTSADESARLIDSSAPDRDRSKLNAIPSTAAVPCYLAQGSLEGIPVPSKTAKPS